MLSKMRKRISVNRPQLARPLSSRAEAMSRDTPANGSALRSYGAHSCAPLNDLRKLCDIGLVLIQERQQGIGIG